MASLYGISIKLSADLKDFSKKLQNAERDLNRFGKNMQRIGTQFSAGLTAPLVAFAALSVKAFDTQAQAVNKLSTQIKLNGKDVDSTLSDYKKFASELQSVTTVGDETTLQLLQLAESMQSSAPKEAVKGAIALSKSLGMDMQAAIKASTLALDGNYTMLNRYVPSLKTASSEAEKAAIVQKLFADGLEMAKTEAETGLGPVKQLTNSWGDFMEKIGEVVSVAIIPLVNKLTSLVDWLNNLSGSTRRVVVTIGAMLSGIGPLIFAIGTLSKVASLMTGHFRQLRVAAISAGRGMNVMKVAMASIPIIAVVAGLVAIATSVYSATEAYDSATKSVKGFKSEIGDTAGLFEEMSNKMVILSNDVKYFKVDFAGFAYQLKSLDISTIEALQQYIMKELADATRGVANATNDLTKKVALQKKERLEDYLRATNIELDKGKQHIVDQNTALTESIALLPKVAQLTREAFAPQSRDIKVNTLENFRTQKQDDRKPGTIDTSSALEAEISLMGDYKKSIEEVNWEYEKLGGMGNIFQEMANITQQSIQALIENGVHPASEAVQTLVEKFKKLEMQAQITNVLTSAIQQMGSALVDAAISGGDAMKSLKNILLGVAKQIINLMLAQALAITIEKAMATSPHPLIGLALAAVAMAGVTALFATKVPKLAKGGLAYKPTYAMIGDNVNASNDPEVVAPLSKLKKYLGNSQQGGVVEFVIRGDKLYGVLDRYTTKRGRIN